MKLAVTDACVFIDLLDIQLTSQFFRLPIEVHTSIDVYNELYEEQKDVLKAYLDNGKLFVHNICSEEKAQIQTIQYPKSLSFNDKTVLHLATKFEAMVLSSDKAVRNFAQAKAIEYHGILWILDQFVETQLVAADEAINKLDLLIAGNILFQNNMKLASEIAYFRNKWQQAKN